MCGIAGLVMRNARAPDPAVLDALSASLAHRGPDASGRFVAGATALVHTRLSIIDLATGDQPLFGPAGSVLIANAEIYNDPDLRRSLPDAPFRSGSDCEPIVHLYERHGPSAIDRLRGMYALALYDPARDRLVLARDPFGIKPLYYAETSRCFAFASEPQALLRAGLVAADIDPRRRAELLQLKFTTGAATIFPGIHRVLPGETLVVQSGVLTERSRRAALPQGGPRPIRAATARARLGQVLRESVGAHLRSDVPYGLFLSGGIDSAALLALMHEAAGGTIEAITIGYEEAGAADESREALRLAAALGARCHRIEMDARAFWDEAPAIAAALDDPTTDAAALPSFLLGRAAAGAGLKVTLCGEGGDELFGGYSRYRKAAAPLRWFARRARSHGVFDGALPALAGWREGLAAAEAQAAIPGRSAVQVLQAVDCAEWLPNDLLIKLDRCLMAHGVEGRTPFVDPLVAEFAFPLPDRQKVGLRFGKLLLRQWLSDAFPAARAFARKQGFKPPVGRWIAARAETIGAQVAAAPGIAEAFDPAMVRGVFAAAGQDGQAAWSLLYYALWHSRHVLGTAPDGSVAEVLDAASRLG